MYGANRLAVGILAVWLAGFCFFFAFHPGGVQIYDPHKVDSKGNPDPGERALKNPKEIIQWVMSHHL